MKTRHDPLGAATAVAEPEPTAAPAASKPAKAGLKKMSFGKIAQKEETKTAYPIFIDPTGEAALIAARIITRTDALAALESSLETDKAELKLKTRPFYFATNHGRHEVPSSISVPCVVENERKVKENREVLVTFKNAYSGLDTEAPVQAVLGEERVGQYFREAFTIKVDGDKLPADQTQELIDELQALFAKYNALDALSSTAKIKPTKEFHAARHLELSVAENLALEEAYPIQASCAPARGRKAK